MTISSTPSGSSPSRMPAPRLRISHTLCVPELIKGRVLAVSTYQRGQVYRIVSGPNGIATNCKRFHRAMGVCQGPNGIAVATGNQIVAKHRCYLTGPCDIHEIYADPTGGYFYAATGHDCINKVSFEEGSDGKGSSSPRVETLYGKPCPSDTRHINGFDIQDGRVSLVSEFGKGWRDRASRGKPTLGKVHYIDENGRDTVVADWLDMPHSPRWHQGSIYFLESRQGTLCKVGEFGTRAIAQLGGFPRGLAFLDADTAVMATSRDRKTGKGACAIWFIDIRPNAATLGTVKDCISFSGVDELFDVRVF